MPYLHGNLHAWHEAWRFAWSYLTEKSDGPELTQIGFVRSRLCRDHLSQSAGNQYLPRFDGPSLFQNPVYQPKQGLPLIPERVGGFTFKKGFSVHRKGDLYLSDVNFIGREAFSPQCTWLRPRSRRQCPLPSSSSGHCSEDRGARWQGRLLSRVSSMRQHLLPACRSFGP